MAEDGWYKRRLAELKAQAPVKREKVKPFVYRLDLSDAAKACTALGCPKVMVWLWLQHESRKTGKRTVSVPNGILAKYGVPRETKRRALRELEAAGFIAVEQRPRKTPLVTLL